jgi:hypothetical protein
MIAGSRPLAAQDRNQEAGPEKGQPNQGDDLPKPLTFKGVAKANVHSFKAEKDATYRITVKTEGFPPLLQIMDEFGPVSMLQASDTEAKIIFTAPHNRNYMALVDFANRTQFRAGAKSYVLTIERANFQQEAKAGGPFQLNEKSYRMTAGKFYVITVKSLTFEPDLRLLAGGKVLGNAFNPGPGVNDDPNAEQATTLMFSPPKTGEYRLLISVGQYSRLRRTPLDYTVTIAERKVVLAVGAQIAKTDPLYPNRRGCLYKVYPVKLEADKTYRIAIDSPTFNSHLYLEDGANKIRAGAELSLDRGFPSHIIYRPTRTENYRIIATTSNSGDTGSFTLMVVEIPHAKRGPGAAPGPAPGPKLAPR